MSNPAGWSVDLKRGIVSHESGLKVELAGGEVIDIINLPRGAGTRGLPQLLQEAIAAYDRLRRGEAPAAMTPSAPPADGPRRSTLSLKGRKPQG